MSWWGPKWCNQCYQSCLLCDSGSIALKISVSRASKGWYPIWTNCMDELGIRYNEQSDGFCCWSLEVDLLPRSVLWHTSCLWSFQSWQDRECHRCLGADTDFLLFGACWDPGIHHSSWVQLFWSTKKYVNSCTIDGTGELGHRFCPWRGCVSTFEGSNGPVSLHGSGSDNDCCGISLLGDLPQI